MGYTNVALKDKILEMYPEILNNNMSVSLNFSEEENAYIIKFKKDSNELTTHLDRNDAEECMNGIRCIHLGIQIGEFIKNFSSRK